MCMRSAHLARQTALGVAVTAILLSEPNRQISPVFAASLPDDARTIVHILSRVGFGARPGDVDKIRTIGVQAYIEQQLHPERIPDGAMDTRLSDLSTLRLSSREIAQQFELPVLAARRDQKQAAGTQEPPTAQPADPP